MPTSQCLQLATMDPPEPMDHPVQRLYEACKGVFTPARSTLSSKALTRLRKILDRIKPLDVGLDEQFFTQQDLNLEFLGRSCGERTNFESVQARWQPPVSYLHLYECDEFSMGIFCLPPSASIPLHDHPGMTVLSKLLYGSMHVKAYDWVDPNVEYNPLQPRLAKLAVDRVMTAPCETAVLYPTSGGNIHAFTAVTACAVLDVLAPPYSSEEGRHCTYYRDLSCVGESESLLVNGGVNASEQSLAWLEESQPPDDFIVKGVPYRGPPIMLWKEFN